ncbi:MAG: hypothetical protein JNM62_03345 [Flavobacteriales bacterium]|nr:hypothetical protein [Flavobacteriales bacterium]
MSPRIARLITVSIVAVHIGMALCYTLPRTMVPDTWSFLSQRYMRPLFHQQWSLFAPDPPRCACVVQVGLQDGSWRPLVTDDDHYLVRRMARPLADHVQEQLERDDTVLMPVLSDAMRGLVRDIGRESPGLRFRLIERCVKDPARPFERDERITSLHLPEP